MKGKFLPVSVVAQRLGVCRQSVYNLIESQDLSAVRTGPKAGIRISESELERFLNLRGEHKGIKAEYVEKF